MDFMLHQNIAFLSHTKIAYLSLSFPRCSHHRNIPWFVPLAPASVYDFGFQSSQLVYLFTVVSYSHCMWDVFSFLSYRPDPAVSPTVGPHPALLCRLGAGTGCVLPPAEAPSCWHACRQSGSRGQRPWFLSLSAPSLFLPSQIPDK